MRQYIIQYLFMSRRIFLLSLLIALFSTYVFAADGRNELAEGIEQTVSRTDDDRQGHPGDGFEGGGHDLDESPSESKAGNVTTESSEQDLNRQYWSPLHSDLK